MEVSGWCVRACVQDRAAVDVASDSLWLLWLLWLQACLRVVAGNDDLVIQAQRVDIILFPHPPKFHSPSLILILILEKRLEQRSIFFA